MMSQIGIVKYSYLAYFSNPASDRPIYRELRQHPVERIVEIGLGSAVRAQRMIEMASSLREGAPLEYCGIDLFEGRPAQRPGIALKAAYKLLRGLQADIRLIPGDPYTALSRSANDLPGTDLLLIAADQDPESMMRAWMFVPRMLHERSLVLREETRGGQTQFEPLSRTQVESLALTARKPLRRSA